MCDSSISSSTLGEDSAWEFPVVTDSLIGTIDQKELKIVLPYTGSTSRSCGFPINGIVDSGETAPNPINHYIEFNPPTPQSVAFIPSVLSTSYSGGNVVSTVETIGDWTITES